MPPTLQDVAKRMRECLAALGAAPADLVIADLRQDRDGRWLGEFHGDGVRYRITADATGRILRWPRRRRRMSWLDDVARVVLDLVYRQSDQPLQDRLAAAQRVRNELPAEPAHVQLYLDELISAAQFTARGILPAARARLSGAVPLIELSPMLGYLVFRVAAADPERTGEAHDLLLRLLEPALAATAPSSFPPVTAIARYDMAASAMLADALPPTSDVSDSLWRALDAPSRSVDRMPPPRCSRTPPRTRLGRRARGAGGIPRPD